MKTLNRHWVLPILAMFAFTPIAHGQLLKKLGKSAERAAERTVQQRVDRETTKKTDAAMDSILEPGSKGPGTKEPPTDKQKKDTPSTQKGEKDSKDADGNTEEPKTLKVYSKFDFVSGDKLLFFDDFSNDFVGDFPSKWDTNGNGEVVTVDGSSEKWFEFKAGSAYFPDISQFAEEYTIEFDLLTVGLDRNTSSGSNLEISIRDNNSYDWYNTDTNNVNFKLPFCQYSPVAIKVWNKINKVEIINNHIDADLRSAMLARPHVSIAVNGQRFRVWVNETKYVDIPRLVAEGSVLNYLRFTVDGLVDRKDRVFLNNLRVAEGGLDLRKQLISEGKVSTNGILFDSGSANIQPQSMGIILQISQVLQQETGMKLNIIGHTDGDGDEASNKELSKKRAEAVKTALQSVYGISGDRLSIDGKGESDPVADNGTTAGKAQNRRVEFIKM